ncbi:MAG: hypothetical protein GPOALKHO_001926 [Sodalis sp.]|uniref:hypothetical protein n=1 Tax=Sodalis sp. (in: enterobacteria) TaxID=1898979 RepID=UPI003872F74E|nr:MAG: hypothetical protein GPOALKHO_001926 [Sodalis sp.]
MPEFGFITEENMKSMPLVSPERSSLTESNHQATGKGGCAATVDDVRLLEANIYCWTKASDKVNTLAKMKMFAAGTGLD